MLDRLLTARTLVPLGVLWAACLVISAIQGEGDSGSGLGGFIAELPWVGFLALSLLFVVVAVVAVARRVTGRSSTA
jgi:hypothetical protein